MHFILAMIIAVILYNLQASYYRKHWQDNLHAKVFYDKTHANIGEIITLTEQVNNEKHLPLPVLYVKFSTSRSFLFEDMDNAALSDRYHRNDIFSVMGQQQIIRKLQFRTTKRGYYAIDHLDLVVHDLFMKESFANKEANHTALYVYPALLTDRNSLSLTSSIIGDLTQTDLYEDPLSFRGIREYRNGDSMRYINWKATAKTNDLMVNTYFDTQNTQVVLLFNLETNLIQRDDKLHEYMIRVVTTLLHHMNNRDFAIRLAINITDPLTEAVIVTDVGKGEEHLQSLLELLSRLDLSRELTPFEDFFHDKYALFKQTNSNTSYIIVSNYRKEALLSEFYDKKHQGHHIYFLCPELAKLCSPAKDIQYWEVMPDEI